MDESYDSPVLIYGLVHSDTVADGLLDDVLSRPGVQSQPVSVTTCGALSVLTSPLSNPAALSASGSEVADVALTHKDVVDAVFNVCTVLPVRFGTVSEADAVCTLVDADADQYASRLDALDGWAEMGLRLTLRSERSEDASVDPAYREDRPGTAYLLAQQVQYRRRDGRRRRVGRTYRTALENLTREMVTAPAYGDEDAVSLAFLVRRDDADAFRDDALAVNARDVSDVEVVGPWAPYSFV